MEELGAAAAKDPNAEITSATRRSLFMRTASRG
jgi:hypothetical protein